MNDKPISFDDGAAYEDMMSVWSRRAGEQFLDWMAPAIFPVESRRKHLLP